MQLAPDFNLNFFLSGSTTKTGGFEALLMKDLQCRLCSCHDMYVTHAKRWAQLVSQPDNQIRYFMLDSGAFTGWKSGHPVILNNLIKTYAEVMALVNQTKVKVFLINLDVIPGRVGVTAGADEVDEAIKQSDKNFEVLSKEFGDCVLPVYHQNESEARLYEICKMANYICASPRNDLPEWTRIKWSEEVHQKLLPGIRTHGLATTGDRMVTRVPWWSVDSASWMFLGAMGKVRVYYNKQWVSISISNESPDRFERGNHYCNCNQTIRDAIDERAAFHGIKITDLQSITQARYVLNGLAVIDWLKVFKFEPPAYQPTLFDL